MSFVLLGILNAQAAGGGAAAVPAYDLLETDVLASSQASYTFSSLDTYSTDYQHLQIRTVMRQDRAVTGFDRVFVQLNGDTGNNYAGHAMSANGSGGVGSTAWVTSKSAALGGISIFSGDTAGAHGVNIIDILDPFNTNKYTTLKTMAGAVSVNQKYIAEISGLWMNTASLTSVTIFGESSTYDCLTGSHFSLYGLRKAA